MNNKDLPAGIRVVTRKSGAQKYEGRVHRPDFARARTFATPKEATNWKTAVETLLDSGLDPDSIDKKKVFVPESGEPAHEAKAGVAAMTVRQAVENYIKDRQQSHYPLPSNYLSDYERVRDDLGNLMVYDLRSEDISHYISLLLTTPIKRDAKRKTKGTLAGEPRAYAKATVRKFIYALKIALEWQARNNKRKLDEFLFDFGRNVMPASWDGKRERRLLAGEEEKLYQAGLSRGDVTYSADDWRALIGFALESAMRQQELALAKWDHIIAGGYKLLIPASHTKTKTKRTILLSKRAREIIELQRSSRPKAAQRIFHQFTSAGAISESFARLTGRAGISNLHFHDLRHEATSRLCESGKLTQMVIMEMTGHKTMKTFEGYVHLIAHENALRLE